MSATEASPEIPFTPELQVTTSPEKRGGPTNPKSYRKASLLRGPTAVPAEEAITVRELPGAPDAGRRRGAFSLLGRQAAGLH